MIKKLTHPPYIQVLAQKVSENAVQLSQNPFGNYAVQMTLEHWTSEICRDIILNILNNFAHLSIQKFSSSVLEKIIVNFADAEILANITSRAMEPQVLRTLMKNSYGYHIVERLFEKIPDEIEKKELQQSIEKNQNHITDKGLKQKWLSLK